MSYTPSLLKKKVLCDIKSLHYVMYSTGGIVKVTSKPDDNTCAECRKNSLQY